MNVADETPDKKPEEQHDDAEEVKQTKRARKPAIEMERWGRPDRSRATCHITWADAPQLDWTSETSLVSCADTNSS